MGTEFLENIGGVNLPYRVFGQAQDLPLRPIDVCKLIFVLCTFFLSECAIALPSNLHRFFALHEIGAKFPLVAHPW